MNLLYTIIGIFLSGIGLAFLTYPVPYKCLPDMRFSDEGQVHFSIQRDYFVMEWKCDYVPRLYAVLFPDPTIIKSATISITKP